MSHPLNRVPLALQSRSSATVTEGYCEGCREGKCGEYPGDAALVFFYPDVVSQGCSMRALKEIRRLLS